MALSLPRSALTLSIRQASRVLYSIELFVRNPENALKIPILLDTALMLATTLIINNGRRRA